MIALTPRPNAIGHFYRLMHWIVRTLIRMHPHIMDRKIGLLVLLFKPMRRDRPAFISVVCLI